MESHAASVAPPGLGIRPQVVRVVPKGRTRPAADPRTREEDRPTGATRFLLAGAEPPWGRLSGPEGPMEDRGRVLGEGAAVALFRGASHRSTRTARHCRGCHSDGRGIAPRGPQSAGKRLFHESAHTSKEDFLLLSPIQRSQRPPAVDTRGSFVGRSTSAYTLTSRSGGGQQVPSGRGSPPRPARTLPSGERPSLSFPDRGGGLFADREFRGRASAWPFQLSAEGAQAALMRGAAR